MHFTDLFSMHCVERQEVDSVFPPSRFLVHIFTCLQPLYYQSVYVHLFAWFMVYIWITFSSITIFTVGESGYERYDSPSPAFLSPQECSLPPCKSEFTSGWGNTSSLPISALQQFPVKHLSPNTAALIWRINAITLYYHFINSIGTRVS